MTTLRSIGVGKGSDGLLEPGESPDCHQGCRGHGADTELGVREELS